MMDIDANCGKFKRYLNCLQDSRPQENVSSGGREPGMSLRLHRLSTVEM